MGLSRFALRGSSRRAPPSSRHVLPLELLLVALAAPSTWGCADLLGLEDLQFDRTAEEEEPVPTELGAGGDSGGIDQNPKMDPEKPLFERWGFPTNWQDVAIVAAQPPPFSGIASAAERVSSSFHVYHPRTGLLTSHRLTTVGASHDVITSQWIPKGAPEFSLVIVRPGAEGLGLFGYYAGTGRSEHAASFEPWSPEEPGPDDTPRPLVTKEYTGSAGWTHAVPLRHPDGWRFLQYNSWDAEQETGLYRMTLADVARAEAENVSAVGGPWEAGWTHLLAYDRGDGQHDLLKVDLETGVVELDRLSEDGWELSSIARNEWEPGWTQVIAFPTDKGPRVLLYDARLGTVVLGQLDDTLALEELESGLWERGWTSLTLFEVSRQHYVLCYNAKTGEARVSHVPELDYVIIR